MIKIAYEEVKDKIVKFEKEGDSVEGIYIAKSEDSQFGNEVYKIQQKNKEIITIFGTIVLKSLMESVKFGDKIKIDFTGIKPNSKKGQNDIKQFKLFVDK